MAVTLTDVTLREGNHTFNHQLSAEFVARVVAGMDTAGVDIIEVGHGDGLGGSSKQVGFAAATDEEYLRAAVGAVTTSRIGCIMVPGIGTLRDIEKAAEIGAKVVRVGVHCTEADTGEQHIKLSLDLGLTTIGHLVNCSMTTPEILVEESRKLADYGVHTVVLADSVGELLPDGVAERVAAIREVVDVQVGFHGHNSMGCAVANSLAAVRHGATMVDGALRGLGGGAGNTQTEALVAALARAGTPTNVDLLALLEVVDNVFAPEVGDAPIIDSESLLLGYSGVYGGYVNPIRREASRLNLDARDIIMELGARRIVAGQEDVVIEVARELAVAKTRQG
ncbi:4-hydroxy-2-oxovalerate aldolase [Rhodococcus opacus]|uniref:4-hydroxy-2-oxovalerate aldolase n=1 Tax=Rhodococcus opacus TaxID=37919 RepID=UPI00223553BF|nr:4-hydroxy-2-oxovalerate aldolase [Rhodococcus opacus]UZG60365.1 4-hydroxy-2-oxovalerate aldolase [Rhodococcus opacus]